MSVEIGPSPERLVKSTQRVRDLGEVFTPADTVNAMLDLLPHEMWNVHPSPTFLEPACGDGNFLVEIFARKLKRITSEFKAGRLPAGEEVKAAKFHALEALASIYAVDISPENVFGGTPGHEIGARQRLLDELQRWHKATMSEPLPKARVLYRCAEWIVARNVQVGNMLANDANGRPTGRDKLPLMEYRWTARGLRLSVSATTLGAVMIENETAERDTLDLFGPPTPTFVWEGPATSLYKAEADTVIVLPAGQKVTT